MLQFLKFCWDFTWQVFTSAYGFIGLIAGIAPPIAKFIEKKYQAKKWKWWVKMKKITRHVPAWMYLILIGISVLLASYQISQEQQKEIMGYKEDLKLAKETFRPMLTVDPKIATDVPVGVNWEEGIVQFSVDYNINNVGNRPAYQTTFQGFTSPLADPPALNILPSRTQVNPIYTGTSNRVRQDYTGKFSIGDMGRVILYLRVTYRGADDNSTLYQDNYWLIVALNTNTKQVGLMGAEQSWIDQYKPYADKIINSSLLSGLAKAKNAIKIRRRTDRHEMLKV